MSAVASQLNFEVLRFAAEPVSGDVVLLELEGRFRAGTRRRLGVPRLVAEHADGTHEVAPAAADEASAEPDGALWRASYAVPREELAGGVFSLAVGRELLVGLPAPDPAAGTGDREVRLAREANALRRTADEARAAAAAALASVGDERRAREAVESELADVRLGRDDLARRVAGVEEQLAQARREHAAELVRRDEEREALVAGHDEQAARAAEERAAEIEAEVAEARRALRAARAEAEGYRRELERERERVEAAEAAVRRGRITEIDGEPIDGDDRSLPAPTAGDHIGDPTVRAGHPTTPDDAGEPTVRLGPAARTEADEHDSEDVTEVATLDGTASASRTPIAGNPGETVRVLGARRPRRTGEGPPADPAPGTAAIGARFIEPGQTPRRSAVAAWLTRLLAFAALAVVIVAVLLVLKPF
jgi:hypothetical protein